MAIVTVTVKVSRGEGIYTRLILCSKGNNYVNRHDIGDLILSTIPCGVSQDIIEDTR